MVAQPGTEDCDVVSERECGKENVRNTDLFCYIFSTPTDSEMAIGAAFESGNKAKISDEKEKKHQNSFGRGSFCAWSVSLIASA